MKSSWKRAIVVKPCNICEQIWIRRISPENTHTVITPYWISDGMGAVDSAALYPRANFNHSGAETRIIRHYMAADALAPCVARTSAAMVLTIYYKWVFVSVRNDLITCALSVLGNGKRCKYIFEFPKINLARSITSREYTYRKAWLWFWSGWHAANFTLCVVSLAPVPITAT